MQSNRKAASPVGALGLEAALVISWSAGFVGIRFAIDYAPISSILLWRSLVSGLILLPLALAIGPRLRLKDIAAQAAFGVFAMAGYLGCYTLAIGFGVPTGLVALVTDMLPLMVAILSWPFLGRALSPRQWFGTALGLVGVVIASGVSLQVGGAAWWAYALPALGTAALAVATLVQKNSHSNRMPVHQRLCIQCLAASLVFWVFAWQEGNVVPPADMRFIGGILWLVFVATFGAWGLYYLALQRSSPARVTAVLYLSPPLTMVWAWGMFAEPMSWAMVVGFGVSLVGILIFTTAGDR